MVDMSKVSLADNRQQMRVLGLLRVDNATASDNLPGMCAIDVASGGNYLVGTNFNDPANVYKYANGGTL